MTRPTLNWAAIDADPRFQTLHRKKMAFLWGLMFLDRLLLPAADRRGLLPRPLQDQGLGPCQRRDPVRLSEFVVAWAIACIYARRANSEFDAMAAEIVRDAAKIGG